MIHNALRLAAAAALMLTVSLAHGQTSTRLKGVVDKGYGEINLLEAGVRSRDLTMAQLEGFRRDNGGKLAFAVDVNEAASGLEKSSSQGVAVEYARVGVTTSTGIATFNQFATQTQSSVARVRTGPAQLVLRAVLLDEVPRDLQAAAGAQQGLLEVALSPSENRRPIEETDLTRSGELR